MEFTGERFLPELTDFNISYEHWHRYLYAGNFIKNKKILDIACGEGYGSYYLSKEAKEVTGVDIDPAIIKYANENYQTKNLKFIEGSASNIPLKDKFQFDVIISFETIEHISEEDQTRFMSEVKRLLKPDGLFIVSTPNKLLYSDIPNYSNEFHLKEFYRSSFEEFLNKSFKHTTIIGQQICIASYISDSDEEINKILEFNLKQTKEGFIPGKEANKDIYMIALCSNKIITRPETSITFDPNYEFLKDLVLKQSIYFDIGDGFSERDKIVKNFQLSDKNNFILDFNLSGIKQLKGLRLDPCDDFCSIKINSAKLLSDGNKKEELLFSTNASKTDNGILTFETKDPQINFLHEGYNRATNLIVDLEYVSIGKLTKLVSLQQRYIELEKLYKEIINLGDKIKKINNELSASNKKNIDNIKIIRQKELLIHKYSESLTHREFLIKQLEVTIKEKDGLLKQNQTIIYQANDALKSKQKNILNNEKEIAQKTSIIKEQIIALNSLEKAVQLRESEILQLKELTHKKDILIKQKDGQIFELEKALRSHSSYIENLKNSLSFRIGWIITAPARLIYERFKPFHLKNSKIWLLMKFLGVGIQKPSKVLKHINSKNLKILVVAFKNEDSKTIFQNFFKLISKNQKQNAIITLPKGKYIFTPWHKNETINPEVKIIAFYLPQFHAIPDNDAWWGKGFTEWTNVKPALPQFKGHHQPNIPGNLGYYNLLDDKTMSRQIEIAKNYGVGGFCFHFYWFEGKRLLEKPIENYLNDKNLDFPFCLSWANENWTRRWDGLENDILMGQQHSPEDDIAFIQYVSKYFHDKRYIHIEKKPILIVYRPELLPSAKETASRWRKWCREIGIGEIFLAYVQSFEKPNPIDIGYDGAVEFPPNNSGASIITKKVIPPNHEFKGVIYDWRSMLNSSENYSTPNYTLFRGVNPSWDNTPRRKNKSTIFLNNTPKDFGKWVYNACIDTIKRFESKDKRIVFVNAWNEWAEGAYLEPDKKNGYAYLDSIYKAQLDVCNDFTESEELCETYSIHSNLYQDRINKIKILFLVDKIPKKLEFLIDYYKFLLLVNAMYPSAFSFKEGKPVFRINNSTIYLANRKSLYTLYKNTIDPISDDIISFVILQYNNVEYTIDCINSIKKLEDKRIRIVVVDNASERKDKAILRENFQNDPITKLIFNNTNEGFASGNNVGYRYSRNKLNAKFIAVINNDTVITQSDFIQRFIGLFEEWSYSLLGPDIQIPDGRHENPYSDSVFSINQCHEMINLRSSEMDQMINTGNIEWEDNRKSSSEKEFIVNPILQGAAIIYSPIYIIDHELAFEELTFLYGEEFVLASNSLVEGELVLYSNKIKILHNEGISTAGLELKSKMQHGYKNAIKSLKRSIEILNESDSIDIKQELLLISSEQISNHLKFGNHNILFDLIFCQGGFHGGGEYGKAIFKELSEVINNSDNIELWVAADPDLFLDEWIWDRCKKWQIKVIPVKNNNSIVQLINLDIFDVFYAPAIVVYSEGYEYMQKIGNGVQFTSKKTKIVGTLHDIRDFEIATNIDKLLTHFKNLKCLPEVDLNKAEQIQQIRDKKGEAEDLRKMYLQLCKSKSINTIITVSEYSRNSILSNITNCDDKLRVLYSPMKHRPRLQPIVINKNGIDIKNFALIVNASRKEKNSPAVIKAFDNLFSNNSFAKNILGNFHVVLTGVNNVKDVFNDKLRNPSKFIFLPYLPSEELEFLYKSTKLLIFMSLNEGFGYPPIEAMSYNKPCIVSNVTSIPEICGDSAIYCNPYNVQSIERGITSFFKTGIQIQSIEDQYGKIIERQKSDLQELVEILVK